MPVGTRAEFCNDLVSKMAESRIVCIGEASHGSQEFYQLRADLTRALIADHGFVAVAVEADWPDAYRVNRFVRRLRSPDQQIDADPFGALAGFERFPAWMWRNTVVADFLAWLQSQNDLVSGGSAKTGFYGIDLYSLYRSIDVVIRYLEKIDPAAARRAKSRYACFDAFHEDPQHYGYAASAGVADSCEDQAVMQLVDLQRQAGDYARRDGRIPPDEYFFVEQNARLVKNAEEYYRTMYRGRDNSWNLRDTHMADTTDALLTHLYEVAGHAQIVLWAHNSHLGDARATDMARRGELNLGQLMRERHPGETFHLGFSTYDGTVLAADNWSEPPEIKTVNPGLEGSYERLFHEVLAQKPELRGSFWLPLQPRDTPRHLLAKAGPLLERAIGVIYRPRTERQSHYFRADLVNQFDAIIHVDRTTALQPLDSPGQQAADEEVPETFPSSI